MTLEKFFNSRDMRCVLACGESNSPLIASTGMVTFARSICNPAGRGAGVALGVAPDAFEAPRPAAAAADRSRRCWNAAASAPCGVVRWAEVVARPPSRAAGGGGGASRRGFFRQAPPPPPKPPKQKKKRKE